MLDSALITVSLVLVLGGLVMLTVGEPATAAALIALAVWVRQGVGEAT